ncbi:MAG TPA: FxsA family protein [Solirubrobacteraceae bacterium]|nr:FxsA family protein [Solirubrobacteraceae bacterium]
MPLLIIVALFVVVPLVELYVLIQVGQIIGALPTIALLVADSILGGVLLRSQGRTAWQRLATTLQSGRPPAREVADGALIIFGGALLLTPGFLTDVLGFLLLLPPTRALVRRVLTRRLATHLMVGALGATRGPRGRRSDDVEGTVSEPGREATTPR